MTIIGLRRLGEPREAGIACALAAAALGLAYLAAAGAPFRYLVVNAAALLLGLVALRAMREAGPRAARLSGPASVVLGAGLLATALLGGPVDGASRWIWIGPLGVQPSLVVLPLTIVAFARRPEALGTLGMALAAVALALQPDRAMAGTLAFSLAVLAIARPGRWPIAASSVAAAAFVATLARPDALPAVPYVDRILFTAFEVHVLAGAAVLAGTALLPLPAVAGWRGDPERRPVYLAFAATWLGCVAAAALGNYPTPVVGYGGSAILGYLLSLSPMPAPVRAAANAGAGAAVDPESGPSALPKRALAA